jgi:carbonic anhydrase
VGHSHCGGAGAALSASLAATGGNLIPVPSHPASDPINVWLLPLTRLAASLHLDAESGLQKLVEENVKVQVANVAETASIQNAWKKGKAVSVHGWVFDIEHGRLRDLGVSRSALRLPMPNYA